MRAAELIGCQVYDADGQPLGTVHDLHFSVHTQADGSLACRLDALECGGIGLGHRLGYGEGTMRGPWPFPQLFRRLARRSLAIPWSQITAVRRPRIDISVQRDQLELARSTTQ
jgi:sporulation protein YlmC with PRC-barrel domain